MDLTAQVNNYCERVDLKFWSEPINAVTNAAFLITAVIMWRRSAGLPLARMLCAILFAIGVGSFLFHTFATRWAAMADVLPILMYIVAYVFVATYAFVGLNRWWSLGAAVLFIPYAALTVPLFLQLEWLGSSASYAPVPVLIAAYAVFLWNTHPATAHGLMIGVAILSASLTFRTLDPVLCDALPLGTHFMWHILNGIMLGWMIEVYRRHMLAGGRSPR